MSTNSNQIFLNVNNIENFLSFPYNKFLVTCRMVGINNKTSNSTAIKIKEVNRTS